MADVEVVGTPEIVKVISRGPAGPGGGAFANPMTETVSIEPATDESALSLLGTTGGTTPLIAGESRDANDNTTTAQRFFKFTSADGTIVAALSWIADFFLKTPVGEAPPAILMDSADAPLSRVSFKGFFSAFNDVWRVVDDTGSATFTILGNGWILAPGLPTTDQNDGETLWVDESAGNVVKRSSAP